MSLCLPLPEWLEAVNATPRCFPNEEAAMQFVVSLARQNVADGGGPFGAAVIAESGELVAAGVNRVIPANASILHAEMLALLLAQQRLRSHDLSCAGRLTLVTSCAPCAMCLGAIPWSGVVRVVSGARGEDAEQAGFDEGDKPENWQRRLEARAISVREDVCREEAATVILDYARSDCPLY